MPHESFRKFINYLNNPDEDGGYYLPNIQRSFVWKEEQIEKLFDSILREYPIGSLLVWKTKNEIKTRRFILKYKDKIKLSDYTDDPTNKPKMLILDGQQRLQSLYLGIKGKLNGKELYFDVLSGEKAPPEDVKYKFKFLNEEDAKLPFISFKDIINADEEVNRIVKKTINCFVTLSEDEKQRIEDNINKIFRVFVDKDNLIYQIVDSIDKPKLYTEDDVVEVFIRANSGGTKLEKSDLLFSLLIASWQDADVEMEDLLDRLNKGGFQFTRDFVLKTCLCLLNKGAAYNVKKFREIGISEKIINNWDGFSRSIRFVKDFLEKNTFIKTDKILPSYSVLIPLIYFKYFYPTEWEKAKNINKYIIRTLITGAFSGNSDYIIDKVIEEIKESKSFDNKSIYSIIREQGRNLRISEKDLLNQVYGSSSIHLFLNLWYKFNYEPAYDGNLPQIDHIFPQSVLRKIKVPNPKTGKLDIMKYKDFDRNQIANCMLLTRDENGAGAKWDILPEDWFSGKPEEYLELHLIPQNNKLWKLENFEEFIEERKKLLLEKFSYLLIQEED